MFIFTLHHVRNIIVTYTHALRYEEFNGTVFNNVRRCSRDQNSKWPPFSLTVAKIEHNLIPFCYINMILFFPFLCFTISRRISTDTRPRKPSNIQNSRHCIQTYARATILCLFLRFSIWARTYWYILVLP